MTDRMAIEVGQAFSLREAFRPRNSRPEGRLRPERPPHPDPERTRQEERGKCV